MKVSNIGRRLKQIRRYAALAPSVADYPRLLALGVARGRPFSGGDAFARIGRRVFPRLAVRVAPLGGMSVEIDPSDVTHMVIFDEIILDHAYDFALPFRPDAVFDLGGHIGLFALAAAHAYPGVPILLFEPNPRNLPFIRRNVELNRLAVEVTPAAVSVADGEAWFDDGPSFAGRLSTATDIASPQPAPIDSSPDGKSNENPSQPGRYLVKIVDFPKLFRARNPQRPLLKIDIEGEELRLMPELVDALPPTCAVYFETHGGEPAWEMVSGLMRSHGFTVDRRRCWEYCVDGFALRGATPT